MEDLLPAAINQAIAKSKSLHLESMQEITGGIPGLEGAMSQLGMGSSGAATPEDDSENT